MSTELKITAIDQHEQADQKAILQHALQGAPLDPQVVRRVQQRSARVTQEMRRVHGIVVDATFEALFRDDES
jgi:hypothetical protein